MLALNFVLPWHPSFTKGVLHVVFASSGKEMGRVDALAIVASMADVRAQRDWTNVHAITHAMSSQGFALKSDAAVSGIECRASPVPALLSTSDIGAS